MSEDYQCLKALYICKTFCTCSTLSLVFQPSMKSLLISSGEFRRCHFLMVKLKNISLLNTTFCHTSSQLSARLIKVSNDTGKYVRRSKSLLLFTFERSTKVSEKFVLQLIYPSRKIDNNLINNKTSELENTLKLQKKENLSGVKIDRSDIQRLEKMMFLTDHQDKQTVI